MNTSPPPNDRHEDAAACPHDPAQFVTTDEGTSYCPACETEARSAASEFDSVTEDAILTGAPIPPKEWPQDQRRAFLGGVYSYGNRHTVCPYTWRRALDFHGEPETT